MLSKSNRLTKKQDFKRVIEKGRSFFVKEFGIKFALQRHSTIRVGIIVPKKIAHTVARRNRVKRQVRHIFLKLIHSITPGYDIVFFARHDFLRLNFREKEDKIVNALKHIKLINN